MTENLNKKVNKNDEKVAILDTGSQIFDENNANTVENNCFQEKEGQISLQSGKNDSNYGERTTIVTQINENEPNNNATAQGAGDISHFFSETNENELISSFPGVDLTKLRESMEFSSLLRMIMKNPSLSDVYACYNAIVSKAEDNSRKKLAQALANASSSVGALASSEVGQPAYFTKEQVIKMSPEQIRQNFQQIRESQSKW